MTQKFIDIMPVTLKKQQINANIILTCLDYTAINFDRVLLTSVENKQ